MSEKERMLKWLGTPPDIEELIDEKTRAKLLALVDSYEALGALIIKSVPSGPERTVAPQKAGGIARRLAACFSGSVSRLSAGQPLKGCAI